MAFKTMMKVKKSLFLRISPENLEASQKMHLCKELSQKL